MKKSKQLIIGLLSVLILCVVGSQMAGAQGISSNGSKAGVTLKVQEEPPVKIETKIVPPTPEEKTTATTQKESTPSGKGLVDGSKILPSMGELAGNGVWIGLGILLIVGVFYQVKRRRK